MSKNTFKKIGRWFGWVLLRLMLKLGAMISSLEIAYAMANFIGTIAYKSSSRRRKVAIDNLNIAFPDMPMIKKEEIARNTYIKMVEGFFELFYCIRHPEKLDEIEMEGTDNLEKALAKKKGVIGVSCHLGNFYLGTLFMARKGYRVTALVRRLRDDNVNDYFYKELLPKLGVNIIFTAPKKECIRDINRTLSNNDVIFILIDQNSGTGGVWVDFFGKLAATPTGPVVFGLSKQAVIVPTYFLKKADGKNIFKFFPEKELIQKENKSEALLINTVQLTRMVEDWIRQYPESWMGWIHRRWKSRPSDEMKSKPFRVSQ